MLRGHYLATLALLWLCLNHYCTLGGGAENSYASPPPPANRLSRSLFIYSTHRITIVLMSKAGIKNFTVYCLIPNTDPVWKNSESGTQILGSATHGKLSPSLVGIRGAAGYSLSEPAQQQGRALALRIQAHSCRGDPDRGRGGSSGCTSASGAGCVGTFHVRAARVQKSFK